VCDLRFALCTPIVYFPPSTVYCTLSTAHCKLQHIYCLLPTANCLLPAACCLLTHGGTPLASFPFYPRAAEVLATLWSVGPQL